MTVHRFAPDDWIEAEDVGSGIRLLHRAEGHPRVEHTCGRWDDPDEPDGVMVTVIAPTLTPGDAGHKITRDDQGRSTITPSILCPSCNLHGYVTNGVWRHT